MKKHRVDISDFPSAIIIIAAAIIYFMLCAPNFLSGRNLTNLFIQTTIPCMLVVGVAIIIMSGGMDLSVGSVLALAGCITGLVLKSGASFGVALAAGVGCGLLCGLLNGLLVAVVKIPPFITTMAMMNIASGITNTLSEKKPVYWDPNEVLAWINDGSVFGVPVYALTGFGVIALTMLIFYKTKYRTNVYVLGGNEEVLHLSGGSIVKWRILIYMTSSLLASLAGILMIARASCADPTSGTGLEFTAVVGAVIGGNIQNTGKGTLFGAVLGAITLSVLKNGMSLLMMQTHWQMVITGIILVIGMLIHSLASRLDAKRMNDRAKLQTR